MGGWEFEGSRDIVFLVPKHSKLILFTIKKSIFSRVSLILNETVEKKGRGDREGVEDRHFFMNFNIECVNYSKLKKSSNLFFSKLLIIRFICNIHCLILLIFYHCSFRKLMLA